jgi:hypothetical protein
MAATTFIAETETGEIVSRSSASRTYAYAVLITSPRIPSWKEGHDPADLAEGVWGWSGDRVNAEKMAQAARKGWPSAKIRIAPALQIAKTEPAFAKGMPDLAWHVLNAATGQVVRYGRTKAELLGK